MPPGLQRQTTLLTIWRTPIYRAALLSLFLAGFGISATIPLFTLFLIQELNASLSVAGLYFVTALAGPFVGMVTGRISDRVSNRRWIIHGSACWLALGWAFMAMIQEIWMAFAVGIVFISFMGTFSAQLFATVRDEVVRTSYPYETQLVSTIRAAYSLGWIVGPTVGSWIGLTVGLRELFVGTALLYMVSQVPFLGVRPARLKKDAIADTVHAPGSVSTIPVFVFSGLCALVMSGETLKLSFLPVYMEGDLSMPSWMSGAVISTQPMLELLFIPATGLMAARFGASRVLVSGIGFGFLGHAVFALSDAPWMLFIGQLFVALLVSAVLGLGITVAQDLYPAGAGFASSVYFGALGLSGTVGGLVGSLSVTYLGLPAVFAVPAAICLVAAIGFQSLARRQTALRPTV